jgi:hypothetical protein
LRQRGLRIVRWGLDDGAAALREGGEGDSDDERRAVEKRLYEESAA